MAPIATNINFNNNNDNTINNYNNNIVDKKNYQKPIKPAPTKGKKKKSGTTPPLKPAKKYRDEDNEITRCKRRLDFAKLGLPFNRANPITVARRNERERKRVKQINSTFTTLRDHLPDDYFQNKNPNKMSKVETLRGAIDYINKLQHLLDDYETPVNGAMQSGQLSDDRTTSPEAAAQHQLQVKQEEQFQRELSDALRSVNQILSVRATDALQNIPVNSPTGSTCSSIGSTASSMETSSPEYIDMSAYSAPLPVYSETVNIQNTAPPLQVSLDEDDLLEFASWF
jgi:hypothetical protein